MGTRTLRRQHPRSCFSLPNAPSLQSLCEQRKSTGAAGGFKLVESSIRRREKGIATAAQAEDTRRKKWGKTQRRVMRGEACCLQTGKHPSSVDSAQWLTFTGCLGSGCYSKVFFFWTRDQSRRQLHQKTLWARYTLSSSFQSLTFCCSLPPSSSNLLIVVCYVQRYSGHRSNMGVNVMFLLFNTGGGCNAFIINMYASRRYKTILKQAAGFQWIGTLLTKSSHS